VWGDLARQRNEEGQWFPAAPEEHDCLSCWLLWVLCGPICSYEFYFFVLFDYLFAIYFKFLVAFLFFCCWIICALKWRDRDSRTLEFKRYWDFFLCFFLMRFNSIEIYQIFIQEKKFNYKQIWPKRKKKREKKSWMNKE